MKLKDIIEQEEGKPPRVAKKLTEMLASQPYSIAFEEIAVTDEKLRQRCPWMEPLAEKLGAKKMYVRFVARPQSWDPGADLAFVAEVLFDDKVMDKIDQEYLNQNNLTMYKLFLNQPYVAVFKSW